MPYAARTCLALAVLTAGLSAASALPFLARRPAHLPAAHAETLRSGYGIADNCYMAEGPADATGRTSLVQVCD